MVRAPRRQTDWITAAAQPTGMTNVPDGATRVVGAVALSEGTISSNTIVRIRGCAHIEIAEATAAAVLQSFGLGIGLFDDRAFAVANAAGLPKPLLDADDEKWMWYHCGYVGQGPDLAVQITTESDGTGRRIGVDLEVDCKAMRKWDENMTLAWVCQNANIAGAATEIDVNVFGRMLIKLS